MRRDIGEGENPARLYEPSETALRVFGAFGNYIGRCRAVFNARSPIFIVCDMRAVRGGFATAIANAILNPFERLNNRRYVKKPKRNLPETTAS